MLSKLLKSIMLISALLIVQISTSNAQALKLTEMTFSSFQGEYQQINSGNLLSVAGNLDDNVYSITLPFTFYYDGSPHTTVYMSANGYIIFNPLTNYSAYYNEYINQVNASVNCMKMDLYIRNGGMYINSTGSVGNRVVTFQWTNNDFYYQYDANMNFQVRLYETSNIVEIVYGSMSYGSYGNWSSGQYYWPRVGWSDMVNNGKYISAVPKPNYSFLARYSDKTYNPEILNPPNVGSVRNATDFSYFQFGLTLKLSSFPSLTKVFPEAGAILERGQIYGTGSNHKPGYEIDNFSGNDGVYVKYKIEGPLPAKNPDYQVVYTATREGSNIDESVPVTVKGISRFTEAKGLIARWVPTNSGDLDLQSNEFDIKGGEYAIFSSLQIPGASYTQEMPMQTFIIALANDLAIERIVSPREKAEKRYPLSSGMIPVRIRIKNIGLNPVFEFIAYCTFTNMNGNVVFEEEIHWSQEESPLRTGDYVELEFTNYRPREVGDLFVNFFVDNLSGRDDEPSNNYAPREGSTHILAVAHEIEASTEEILAPAGNVFVGRPIRPQVRFANNGVSDISDSPGRIVIYNEKGDTVFSSNIIIQDIPSGKYNSVIVVFSDDFIPPAAGTYTACAYVNEPNDPVPDNNKFCQTFEVVHAMAGTYTIGTRFAENARNYMTIQDAINDIYLKGLTGPVTFELTDQYYQIGNRFDVINPSLDLSSMIVGLNDKNTMSFVPSSQRSVAKGSVEIRVVGGSGVGFFMGQNTEPANPYAPYFVVRASKQKEYANFPGYIIFDGGDLKSIKVTVDSPSPFKAPFYLGRGTSNVTIKNILIENLNNEAYCDLPKAMFNSGTSAFVYEADNRSTQSKIETYSSGIVLRSTVPKDKNQANAINLDTLFNQKNLIVGNEIKGFGYGIVSLGNGVLYRQGHAKYVRYYNQKNEFINNMISNVTRAGIFLGNEENSDVRHNRIYNVIGSCGNDAAGIIVGGDKKTGWNGYNNIDIRINSNEIHDVMSSITSYGIKVEQSLVIYQDPVKGQVYFPDVEENVKVYNNVVWNLKTSSATGNRAGIHLLTTRATMANYLQSLLTPLEKTYRSRNDKIYNNTIIINDDGYTSNGVITGIAVQETDNTKLMNNAIALLDNDVNEISPVYSAITYQGLMPGKANAIQSDRNAFYYPTRSGGSILRFFETDESANLLEGHLDTDRNAFMYLGQWQVWTKQDINSVFGDFTTDLIYTGTEPDKKLRVNTFPQTPLGSILNNRGQRLTDVLNNDVDMNVRGSAGQRYDIGACEFDGRMYITDVEVLNIPQPSAYLANTFNDDAEYIMAIDPIEVAARIRNNGNLDLTDHKTYIYIFRERYDGSFPTGEANAEVADTISFNIPQTETKDIIFNLADGKGKEFYPKTYYDLRNDIPAYVMHPRFKFMDGNVTPRYKIEIHVEADQNNANNKFSKIVRFYHPRSDMRFLISNSFANEELEFRAATEPNPTQHQIAGRLNFDSLAAVVKRLGWSVDSKITDGKIDVFNRNAWEEKTVDYSWYRTMFWSDGEDVQLTRYPVKDIMAFLDNGTSSDKKNLVIGSQDIVRANRFNAPVLVQDYFRANYQAPGNPLGRSTLQQDYNVDNNGNSVKGETVGRDLVSEIISTNFTKYTGDTPPYCGLMSVVPQGEGIATPAYLYINHKDVNNVENGDIMGVANTTIQRNVVLLGVDWRHWKEIDLVVRASIDFLEKSGGVVVPIELLSFDAKESGNRVNIFWKTATELNSDRFEVEKAEMTDAGKSIFSKINETKAQGTSSIIVNYGPVVDRDVKMAKTYFYRLKMIDLDGQYKYSNEVEVTLGNTSAMSVGEVLPNPANLNAEVQYSLSVNSNIEIAVYNSNGEKIMTLFSGNKPAGNYVETINTSKLASGAYTIVFSNGSTMIQKPVRIVK